MIDAETEALAPDLVERVLDRLGLAAAPEPSLAGLRAVYAAWCEKVPFDNILKLIHLRSGDPGPLPGESAPQFFETWLRFGVGGTCCAVSGGLHALLSALGFTMRRATATMMMAPGLPPNHALAVAAIGDDHYAVDATMLYRDPLRLDPTEPSEVAHPAWGVRCRADGGSWTIRFRPIPRPEGLDCRIGRLDGTRHDFHLLHEGSRRWSPFNYELAVRLNRGDEVIGAAFGRRVQLTADGKVAREWLRGERRIQFLIEEIGIHEEIATAVPADARTPAPPKDLWS